MGDPQTTSGLTPRRLARLLALGVSDAPGPTDPARAALDELLDLPDAAAGRTARNLLLGERGDLAALERVKRQAKALRSRSDNDVTTAAATAVYYAAIARALVAHNRRITSLSCDEICRAFANLRDRPWMPAEIAGLLAQAAAACKQRKTRG